MVVSETPGPGSELAFAVVSGLRRAEVLLGRICDALGSSLSRPVTPRVLPSYAALKEEQEAGRAPIVWAPPKVAIELESEGIGTIALCCTRGGQIAYHAALFTQHTSRIEKLADLKGAHVAWVDAQSVAGYLMPRLRLASEGLDPATLFGQESFLGSHVAVTCAVLDGAADVGATYLSLDARTSRPLSAGWLEAGAGINAVYILATAGPIPSDAIVLSRGIPADVGAAIKMGLMDLSSSEPDAVGRLLGADGFASPPTSHFDALRAVLAPRAS